MPLTVDQSKSAAENHDSVAYCYADRKLYPPADAIEMVSEHRGLLGHVVLVGDSPGFVPDHHAFDDPAALAAFMAFMTAGQPDQAGD